MASVLSTVVTLKKAGIVDVDGAVMMGFSAVPAFWRLELWIDGHLVWAPNGTYPGDCVPIGGVLYCDAGDRTVELKFRAARQVTLGPRYLKVRGFNSVSG